MNTPTGRRIVALDVFRGMTIAAMILVNTPGSWDYVYAPLLHSQWEGCTFTDLIFPFFLFIVGVSMWFSFQKYPLGLNKRFITKIVRRSLLIFLIGLILTWFPFFGLNVDNLQFTGVLQRIAVCFLFAALICKTVPLRWIPGICLLLLFVYWRVIYMVAGEDDYAKEIIFSQGIDLVAFRSCISSSVAILIGYLVGALTDRAKSSNHVLPLLLCTGAVMILLGRLWGEIFPIIKSLLWSSSYLVYSVGFAIVVFAACLWIFERKGTRYLARPFEVFGINPLFIYAVSILADEISWLIHVGRGESSISLHTWLFNHLFDDLSGLENGSLLYAICFVGLNWLIAFGLYKRRIIIKV
jgi:predicted acyltransferase